MNSETEYYAYCIGCTDESRRFSRADAAENWAVDNGFVPFVFRHVPEKQWLCGECLTLIRATPQEANNGD